MLDWLRKRFLQSDTSQPQDDSAYNLYDAELLKSYKNQYPDIQIGEIKIPAMNTSPSSFQITKWFKQEGEQVYKGNLLCEVHSEKAVFELETYVDGYIYYRQQPGKTITTGQVVCVILSKSI